MVGEALALARPWLRRATTWHVASLAVALVAILLAGRHQWFFFDEWAFLEPQSDGELFKPHAGHWSTSPILITHVLRAVFGTSTYWPYLAVSVLLHLAICHVLWRLMLRIGAAPAIATALAFLLALLGAGAENILWAFQLGYLGAILLGLIVILLADSTTLTRGRWIVIVLLSILSLTFSGTAIPLLLAAGLVSLVRRGPLRTAALFAPAAVVYVAWYALFAAGRRSANGASTLDEFTIQVPRYVGHFFVDGFDRVLPFAGFGAIAVACLLAWAVITYSRWRGPALAAYALTAGVVLQAVLTAVSRLQLGTDGASSSRYVYALIALLLPAIALAFTWFARERRAVIAALVVLVLLVTAFNAALLGRAAAEQAAIEQDSRQKLYAALELVTAPGADYDPDTKVEPLYAPDLRVEELIAMYDAGWITVGSYSESAMLSARTNLDVVVLPHREPDDLETCTPIGEGGQHSVTDDDGTLHTHSTSASGLWLTLADGDIVGYSRSVPLDPGWNEITFPADLVLTVSDYENLSVLVCAS